MLGSITNDGLLCEECNQQITWGDGTPRTETYGGGPAWEHCDCPGATANHDARNATQRQQREEFEANRKAVSPMLDFAGLRKVAASDNKAAARERKEAELKDRELSVKDREMTRRERRADEYDADAANADAANADAAPVGATLADFTVAFADGVDLAPLPAVVQRQDGATVLYAGKLNWIFGLPGSGKSWVSIIAIQEAVLRGGNVLLLDFEDTPATFQRRAALLGFNPALYADSFRYIRPGLTDTPTAITEAQQWLTTATDASMSLAVVDGRRIERMPFGRFGR